MGKKEHKRKTKKKSFRFIRIIIYILLVLIISINLSMVVKSYLYPEEIPDFLGYKPLIVLSGSMEPTMITGDLAFVREISAEKIVEGDVIAFRKNISAETAIIHRVKEVVKENGVLSFLTKGDANTGVDEDLVKAEEIEGRYLGRIGGLGRFALFLQTPMGMLLFMALPLFLFLIYDMISRNRLNKQKSLREAELEAELEALKADQKKSSQS